MKKPIYDDDLLLGAVVQYAKVYAGKIEASKLAKWSNENVPGLEFVKYYHFLRPLKTKNPKTGKINAISRPCRLRIDEINKTRSVIGAVTSNVLLSSSNLDEFFGLTKTSQRNCIITTREQVESLIRRNTYLEREINVVKDERDILRNLVEKYEESINTICNQRKETADILKHYIVLANEDRCQEALAALRGVGNKTHENLLMNTENGFEIMETVKAVHREVLSKEDFTKTVLEGLDF